MVDPKLLTIARLEAGVPSRAIAVETGIGESAMRSLEKGNSSHLPMSVGAKVAEFLGVAPADICHQSPRIAGTDGPPLGPPAGPDAAQDARVLEVFLFTYRRKLAVATAGTVLGWDRARLQGAITALNRALEGRGLKVHVVRSQISLAPLFDPPTATVVSAAERYNRTRSNLNWVSARALYATLDPDPDDVKVPHGPTHMRGLATLVNAGLVDFYPGVGWRLSQAVAFSLAPALASYRGRRPRIGGRGPLGRDDALWEAIDDQEGRGPVRREDAASGPTPPRVSISQKTPVKGTSSLIMPSIDHVMEYLKYSDSPYPFFSCMVRRAQRAKKTSTYTAAVNAVLSEYGADNFVEADRLIRKRFEALVHEGVPPRPFTAGGRVKSRWQAGTSQP